MSLVGKFLTYRLGKSRGRRAERRRAEQERMTHDERDPDCVNYAMFCMTFGSCDGQTCEYD